MLPGEGSYFVLCNVDHPTRDNSPERRVRVGKMHSKASKLKTTLVPRDLRQCKVIWGIVYLSMDCRHLLLLT